MRAGSGEMPPEFRSGYRQSDADHSQTSSSLSPGITGFGIDPAVIVMTPIGIPV